MRCPYCGAEVKGYICEYCDSEMTGHQDKSTNHNSDKDYYEKTTYRTQYFEYDGTVSRKNKWIALILCFVAGYYGVHYFYVGRVGKGILYLCTMGLFGIGWIIDIVKILSGNFVDNLGLPLQDGSIPYTTSEEIHRTVQKTRMRSARVHRELSEKGLPQKRNQIITACVYAFLAYSMFLAHSYFSFACFALGAVFAAPFGLNYLEKNGIKVTREIYITVLVIVCVVAIMFN